MNIFRSNKHNCIIKVSFKNLAKKEGLEWAKGGEKVDRRKRNANEKDYY